ncbi:MAG: tRNA (adenosine(37)-N6)-threonylcarbamoyltransferase complex ATPase subunit type 1 TsaE [Fusobacteriaceae bacterium]|nr:tRNA (adenosine(37)-N6)-threonylcarbamoyltransferase complex ATPase subunit type 1 TsaE [Fusobacteriaceae bacterium]MBN2838576.1 tRNA (adenosine(37)-N6)-threonylcarbamoyltransferase complex ATPase subunit type 1 TsaE [Fusobacteriaceae bacterium]
MKKNLSFGEIDELVVKLSKYLKSGDVISLEGDLGTGKTTIVQKISKELGIKENIKSPTFNYVLEYNSGKFPLYHFDVYRISDPMEIYEIGYEDYIYGEGVTIIEWGNIIETELPKEYIKILLEYTGEESRNIEVRVEGNRERERELLKNVGFSN